MKEEYISDMAFELRKISGLLESLNKKAETIDKRLEKLENDKESGNKES